MVTYCQEKLPVMPSFSRSRNDLCLLGPEPPAGPWPVLWGDCKCIPIVVLPDFGRLGEDVAEFSPLLLPPPRPNCTGAGRFTTLRGGGAAIVSQYLN